MYRVNHSTPPTPKGTFLASAFILLVVLVIFHRSL
jgi:hypothetical protein